ncbi:MAG: methyl-accepting chemotaxis protein [Desulfobacteraceae bacterium]|nr:MAG: methyl-accepting chemotaxis protein [Desulfobacteraceae bacterium]
MFACFITALMIFAYKGVYGMLVKESLSGLMNFVDAKQQGVIRFLDQNIKFSHQLAAVANKMNDADLTEYFKKIVQSDVFDIENHPFKDEIRSGKRRILTFKVYHAIDFVKNGEIKASSDTSRIGKPWRNDLNPSLGYSDPYVDGDKAYLTFAAPVQEGGKVYIHADAFMLTNIVNGEIGNLAGKAGVFYLAGVGRSLDYYIVNKNNLMITESRVFPGAFLKQTGSKFPWDRNLNGGKGVYQTNAGITTGAREAMGFYSGADGNVKLGASMPFYDSQWTIVVEQDESEILGPLLRIRNAWLLATIIMLAGSGCALTFYISRMLKPLYLLKERMHESGNLAKRVRIISNDELGDLARWFNIFMGNIQKIVKEIVAGTELLTSSSTSLSTIAANMSTGAEQTSAKANMVASASEQMNNNMCTVASASEQASANVGMVATSAEQMSATIGEIAHKAEKARSVSKEAVSTTEGVSETLNWLGKAAQEISKVTEAITEISNQTNLLALNATIEAARAGDTGRGFAVVANEIKELARQTALATGEIKSRIQEIQDSTAAVIGDIGKIPRVINEVNDIVSIIATAVEEQSVTTKEIATNVAHASHGILEVTQNVAQSSTVAGEIARDIAEVNQASGEMADSSSQVKISAEELSRLAGQLKEMVRKFTV